MSLSPAGSSLKKSTSELLAAAEDKKTDGWMDGWMDEIPTTGANEVGVSSFQPPTKKT